ncbi:MAG TPA: hypothetical protein PLB81_09945 [Deltaproteobacteria bacterium]|nr:hypothetical protein [Deltaproteobacteria bacterium]
MKRLTTVFIAALVFLSPVKLMALDTTVQVNGPDELAKLKPGVEQSIQARLVARGIDLTAPGNLTVTISQMGANLSFDAILALAPPKGYHKDITGVDAISATIDEMIEALFGPIAAPAPKAPTVKPAWKTIELPFQATSVASLGDTVFVAGESAVHKLEGDRPVVWWKVPDKDTIMRISAYQDSIIALTRHERHYLLNEPDQFISYRIKEGRTIQKWDSAVVPTVNGLASAVLKIAPDITFQANRWSTVTMIEGMAFPLPAGTDIIAATVQEVAPQNPGPEIISFSPSGKLKIANASETLWSSQTSFATLPMSLQEDFVAAPGATDSDDSRTRTQFYYLPPRILVWEGMVMTIDNNAGLFGILDNSKVYRSCQIRSYAWTDLDFEERTLFKTSLGYCTDIAIQNDMLLALIVRKKGSLLIYTGLTRG